jgi:multidrug resistance efflux pump
MTLNKLMQRLRAALRRARTAEARVRELEAENAALKARVRQEGARRSALHDLSRHTF